MLMHARKPHIVLPLPQFPHEMRSHEAQTASHQNFHFPLLFLLNPMLLYLRR